MPDKPNTERPQRIELPGIPDKVQFLLNNLPYEDWEGLYLYLLSIREAAAGMAPQDGLREALEQAMDKLHKIVMADSTREWEGCVNGVHITYGDISMAAQIVISILEDALAASPAAQQTTKLDIPTTNEGWMRLLCDAKGRPDYTLINNIIAKAQHEAMAPAGQSEPLISSMPWWSKEEEDENTPVLSPETILEGK